MSCLCDRMLHCESQGQIYTPTRERISFLCEFRQACMYVVLLTDRYTMTQANCWMLSGYFIFVESRGATLTFTQLLKLFFFFFYFASSCTV